MLRLNRKTWIQLAVLFVVTIVSCGAMAFNYMKLPETLFGIGEYTVSVDLPQSGGLYENSVVTYRGTDVGQVKSVNVTATGVRAVLALRSGVKVPADVQASVHSRSAIGEQYIELTPLSGQQPESGTQSGHARSLGNGDVISAGHVDVPVDIGRLLDMTNRALQAIPRENLRTVINESDRAVAGLGPELSRIVDGSTALAIAAGQNVGPLTTLIDQAPPVLNSQVQTADAIATWAHRTAAITAQFQAQDAALRDLLRQGSSGLEEGRTMLDRVAPAVPVLFANLVSLGDIAVVYRHDIEQILVLAPQGIAVMAGSLVPNTATKQDYRGFYLDFNLNMNLPPPCRPASYRRHSDVRRPAWTRPTARRPNCTAGCRRIPNSMSVARATFRARPSRGSGPRPSKCVKATRSTCHSTTATTGRATPMPPPPARGCRSIRRARTRGCHRPAAPHRHRCRRRRRWRWPPTTRPPATTWDPTGTATPNPIWRIHVPKTGSRCWCPHRER